jgi:molybdenum cofactor biosynthesis enzyme MoaA
MISKQFFRSLKDKLLCLRDVSAESAGVRSIDVQLNTLCNADCFFCVAHDKSPTRIDFASFQERARHVHMETVEELICTGGEPTLNKDLERIVRFMDEEYPRAKLRVITNALHLSSNLIDSLLLKNVASIHFSMNASNAADAALRKGLKEGNPLPGCRACYKQIYC